VKAHIPSGGSGGSLDRLYNWLVGGFFVLACLLQASQPANRGRLPEALGTATGEAFWVAVLLFVVFKIISGARKPSS
jgi:hypothetical protein